MKPLSFDTARSAANAVELLSAAGSGAKYLAGGTTLFDLMKLGVEAPSAFVDVTRIDGFGTIDTSGDELVFGAGAKMAEVAADPFVVREYPMIAESLDLAASQQLRNMASLGGNLLQRTRCPYFRGGEPFACNKRVPHSGCGAHDGNDRASAVLGGSDACIAVYPGDWAIALVALDAVVDVLSLDGARSVPLVEFHTEPGSTPHIETVLAPGELITAIRVPKTPTAAASTYLKIRDRESYAFALASCAAAVRFAADGTVDDVRIAIGGAVTRPWRCHEAELLLRGTAWSEENLRAAAEACYIDAVTGSDNTFKVELGTRTVVDALNTAARRAQR